MKNILITGGCGFIGSNFIKYLLARSGHKIINLDALTYAGNPENLIAVKDNPRYAFRHESINHGKAVAGILKKDKIDAIIHFAAESHVDRSITDCAPFIKTNVVGTQTLLDAARGAGIQRFIHISTDEVYGSLGPAGLFTEETPLAPNSPYSASKAASDLLVRAFIHTHKFPAIIVRCSNNYGPYQFPEKFIPLSISNALDGQPIPLYGDGLNVRDWIYVEDFCEAIVTVFQKGKIGEIYNAGGNAEMKNIDVLHGIRDRLDKPRFIIKLVRDRPGHDRRYAMDTAKMKRELGWQPRHTFDQGIKKTINWYRKNNRWLNNVKSGTYRAYYDAMYTERLK